VAQAGGFARSSWKIARTFFGALAEAMPPDSHCPCPPQTLLSVGGEARRYTSMVDEFENRVSVPDDQLLALTMPSTVLPRIEPPQAELVKLRTSSALRSKKLPKCSAISKPRPHAGGPRPRFGCLLKLATVKTSKPAFVHGESPNTRCQPEHLEASPSIIIVQAEAMVREPAHCVLVI